MTTDPNKSVEEKQILTIGSSYKIVRSTDGVVVGTIARTDEMGVKLGMSRDAPWPEMVDQLRSLLESRQQENGDLTCWEEKLSLIQSFFFNAGCVLKEIEPEAITTCISLNAVDGVSVGESKAISGQLSDSGQRIARKVFEAIASHGPKMGADLLDAVRLEIDQGNHSVAWEKICEWRGLGAVFAGGMKDAYRACVLVDYQELPQENQKEFLLVRSALASAEEIYDDQTASDVEILQHKFAHNLSDKEKMTLKTMEANIASSRGRKETAYVLWRQVADASSTVQKFRSG